MKYFLGFLASVGLIALVLFLVIRGFGGNRTPENQVELVNYANTNVVVRLTVDGPIISQQEHNFYEITVGRSEARMDVFQGYERQLLRTQNYPNNTSAYANFLRAIDLAGFAKGEANPANDDPRGVCATGNRYEFEIVSGASQIQRFWTTSCGGQGTFRGEAAAVRQLFTEQIPDFSKLTSRLEL